MTLNEINPKLIDESQLFKSELLSLIKNSMEDKYIEIISVETLLDLIDKSNNRITEIISKFNLEKIS